MMHVVFCICCIWKANKALKNTKNKLTDSLFLFLLQTSWNMIYHSFILGQENIFPSYQKIIISFQVSHFLNKKTISFSKIFNLWLKTGFGCTPGTSNRWNYVEIFFFRIFLKAIYNSWSLRLTNVIDIVTMKSKS